MKMCDFVEPPVSAKKMHVVLYSHVVLAERSVFSDFSLLLRTGSFICFFLFWFIYLLNKSRNNIGLF